MERRSIILFFLAGLCTLSIFAQEKDSIKVEALLKEAAVLPTDSSRTLFFAKKLLAIPYVAGTLDESQEETLVIHLDKADCTTFVETVLALAIVDNEGKRDFNSFKQALMLIRYRDGKLNGYSSRLHYFSEWIKDNEKKEL